MVTPKQEIIERRVCAIATYDNDFIQDPNLQTELFTVPQYKTIVQIAKQVFQKKKVIAMEDMAVELNKYGLTDLYIQLMDISFEKSRYEDLLDQLLVSYACRQSQKLLDDVNNESITFDEFQADVAKLNNNFNFGLPTKWSADELMYELTKQDEKIIFKRDPLYMEVVQPCKNTVNVIAARTGIGKSAYVLNLINDLAERYKCLYFNLEMTEKEVYQRLIAIQSKVPIQHFTHMTDRELNSFEQAIERFDKKLNISIYNGSKSTAGIRKIVGRESRKEHCIVVVDHIGYVTNRDLKNTRERVQQTMIDLNNLTKDFDCTVFAISQLNRNSDNKPRLIDLKDSGEIEQTAHSVVLIWDITNDIKCQMPEYQLRCEKNRGSKGYKTYFFERNTQRFIGKEYQ